MEEVKSLRGDPVSSAVNSRWRVLKRMEMLILISSAERCLSRDHYNPPALLVGSLIYLGSKIRKGKAPLRLQIEYKKNVGKLMSGSTHL